MHPARYISILCAALALAIPAGAADAPASPAPDAGELQRQLTDAQDKLATSLRSYSLLQDENAQLKADAEKCAADKAALAGQIEDANRAIASLKAEAALAAQVGTLRTQLRQIQDQAADLAAENARLRTRLALRGPSPAGGLAPSRPAAP